MIDRIYLASKSPRRRELLQQSGIRFDPVPFRIPPRMDAEISEEALQNETVEAYVRRVAIAKATHATRLIEQRKLVIRPVLAADTTLDVDGEIIGKPKDGTEAVAILTRLSGRKHRVLTAIAVAHESRVECALSASDVWFRSLTEAEILNYVATGESMDKAGAYGLQGRAALFVENICGSPSGIIGLPLCETALLLRSFGYPA